MCERSLSLRALVNERLTAAAEEIFALVERTIAEYEEELCRSKEENQRKQQLLDSVLKTAEHCGFTEAQQQEQSPCLEPGDFSAQIKDYSEIPGQDLNCSIKTESEEQTDDDNDWTVQTNSSTQPQTELDADQFPHVQTEGARGLFSQFKFEVLSTTKSPPEISATTSDFCAGDGLGVEKKHQCSFCEKKFRDKHNLKRHITVHTGEKPFCCPVCARRFSQKETLRLHMALHSRTKAEVRGVVRRSGSPRTAHALQPGPSAGASKSAPFSCPLCARCFTRPFSLQSHMVTHTGEKPFLCLQCNMRFNRKSNLKRHSKIHATQ